MDLSNIELVDLDSGRVEALAVEAARLCFDAIRKLPVETMATVNSGIQQGVTRLRVVADGSVTGCRVTVSLVAWPFDGEGVPLAVAETPPWPHGGRA